MRNQLTELLTNYGEIFEVWFDGANGGDGWYGGANETRIVDKFSYYGWPETIDLVRKLQPGAMLFSDAGPDVRWVGNEHGFAYETTWSNLMRDSVYAGMPEFSEKWATGQENGTHWVPAESDVSIRPGWYYHAYEDHKVKTLPQLLEIFYNSIGRNSSMLINFPVDRRGLIHEKDEAAILALGEKIKADFAVNLAAQAVISASTSRGKGYQVEYLLDGDYETYWTTGDGDISASVELDFGKETVFNRLLLQEYTPLGQRQKAFSLEKEVNGNWEKIVEGTTIGYKRILRFPLQKAQKIRVNFEDGKGIPVISELGVYHAPALLNPPNIKRDKSGEITLTASDSDLELRYSLDGSEPCQIYSDPIPMIEAKTLKALSFDPNTQEEGEVLEVNLDHAKAKWSAMNSGAEKAFDENPATFWASENNELALDLGELLQLKGFTYFPMQARYPSGFIQNYEFQISADGKIWKTVSQGEFANIANNPIPQEVRFDSVEAQFIRLKAIKTTDGNSATFAELGILTR
jgi:alpha-L-fucosidase